MSWKKTANWFLCFVLAFSTMLSNVEVFAEEDPAEPVTEEIAETEETTEPEQIMETASPEEMSAEEEEEVPVPAEETEVPVITDGEPEEKPAEETEEPVLPEETPEVMVPAETEVPEEVLPAEETEAPEAEETEAPAEDAEEAEETEEEETEAMAEITSYSLTAEPSVYSAELTLTSETSVYSVYAVYGSADAMNSLPSDEAATSNQLSAEGRISMTLTRSSSTKQSDGTYLTKFAFHGTGSPSSLDADTEYIIQLFNNSSEYVPGTGYVYKPLSERITFKTLPAKEETAVAIKGLKVVNGHTRSGYYYELTNPDDEVISGIEFVTESDEIIPGTMSSEYQGETQYTYVSFENNVTGKLTPRVKLYNGSGTEKYVYGDPIEAERLPLKAENISVSTEPKSTTARITATISDYVKNLDSNLYLHVSYRKKGDTSYSNTYSRFYSSTGDSTVSITGLKENTEYEYYYVICDTSYNIDNNATVKYTGEYTAGNPGTFETKQLVVYTEKDFGDPQLYTYLFNLYKKNNQLTDEALEEITYGSFNYSSMNVSLTSIRGIELLKNLTSLDLTGHSLQDINEVTKLEKLTSLTASYADLKDIPDLSGTKIESLYLYGNYLTAETLTADKLPAKVLENSPNFIEYTLNDQMKDEVVVEETYSTNGGKFTFLFGTKWKTSRALSADVTINGKSATFSPSSNYSTNKLFYVEDLNSADYGFGLETGKDYEASFRIYDATGRERTYSKTIRFETNEVSMDQYELSDTSTYNYFYIYVFGQYASADVSALVRDQKGTALEETPTVNVSSSNAFSRYYPTLYNAGYYSYSSGLYCTQISLRYQNAIPEGTYDAVLTLKGTEHVLEDRIISYGTSAGILVSSASITSNYDNYGKYVHVRISMSNGYTEDIIPVLYADGVQITDSKPVNVISYSHSSSSASVIFVLKKTTDIWENEAISFDTGAPKGRIEGTIELTNPKNVKYKDLRKDKSFYISANNYRFVSYEYNYKKHRFEFMTSANIPAGTEMTVTLHKDYNGEAFASGTGTTDADHMLYIAFKDAAGKAYEPYATYFDVYYKTAVTIDGSEHSISSSGDFRKYNYNGISLYGRTTIFTSELGTSAYLNWPETELDTENCLIEIINKSTNDTYTPVVTWTRRSAASSSAYYTVGMQFEHGLPAGNYTVQARFKDDTEVLDYYSMYVKEDDGKFYQEDQSLNRGNTAINGKSTPSYRFNSYSVTLAQYHTAEALEAAWNEGGYNLHFYDENKNELTGWKISLFQPVTETSTSNLVTFVVTGLDQKLTTVWARIARDDENPIYTRVGKDYYEYCKESYSSSSNYDVQYGEKYTFSSGGGSSSNFSMNLMNDSTVDHIYYGLNISGTDGYPVTVTFYPAGISTPVKTITISSASDLNYRNYHYFTEEDLKGTSQDVIYDIVLFAKGNGRVDNDTGYVGKKDIPNVKPVSVTGVSLNQTSLSLLTGQTGTLTAVIAPSNATNKAVTWKSSNPAVATVNNGTVTAVAAGITEISVTTADGNKTAKCTVTVAEPVVPKINDVYTYINGLPTTLKGYAELDKNTELFFEAGTGDTISYKVNDGEWVSGNKYTYPGGEVTLTIKAVNEQGEESEEYVLRIEEKDTSWESEPGDVIPEDAETAGESIPEGLWVTDLEESVKYTGKAIKVTGFRVYNYKTLLKSGTDYTVSYKDNKNAGEAYLVIKGKGNYSGTVELPFTIKPIDLSETTAKNIQLKNTGAEQVIKPAVKWGSKTLKKDIDYTVSEITDTDFWTNGGEQTVTLTGVGNYTGTKDITVYIPKAEEVLMSKASIKLDAKTVEYGEKPEVTVTYKQQPVDAKAYEVIYPEDQAGKTALIVKGTGEADENLGVAFNGEKSLSYTIKGTALSKKTVTVEGNISAVYTGKYQESELKLAGLSEGTDYEVVQARGLKAGKYTAVFTGKGAYSGTYKVTWTITANPEIILIPVADQAYATGGATPEVIVRDAVSQNILVKGTDYTVKYTNNKKIGTATVKVTGKGNYKGASDEGTFDIHAQDLSALNVSAKDVNFTNKKNKYKSTPVVTDVNGKKVAAKEYTVSYSYSNGLPVGANDIPEAGTVIVVTVTGKGTNYTGTKKATYKIIDKADSIADTKKFTVTVNNGNAYAYTGKAINPTKDEIVLTGPDGVTEDFEIVSYGTNIKKGTGTVVIRGTGELGGTRTVKFSIGTYTMTGITPIRRLLDSIFNS